GARAVAAAWGGGPGFVGNLARFATLARSDRVQTPVAMNGGRFGPAAYHLQSPSRASRLETGRGTGAGRSYGLFARGWRRRLETGAPRGRSPDCPAGHGGPDRAGERPRG